MQKLIIVCGLPGSGKTTLAKELSKTLKIVCLHKDSIKENLYEILGLSTLEESKQVGNQAIQLLYKQTDEQLENGLDIIIEAPFYFEQDYKIFENWESKYKLKVYSVICKVDQTERAKRFKLRERHHSHHDNERQLDLSLSELVYEKLPGKKIEVDTSQPLDKLIEKLSVELK